MFKSLRVDEIEYKILLRILVLLELPELLYKPHVIRSPLYATTSSVILSDSEEFVVDECAVFCSVLCP